MKTKMIFRLLALLCIAVSFEGCDGVETLVQPTPAYFRYNVYVNNSDYTVRLSSSNVFFMAIEDGKYKKYEFGAVLAPGESYTVLNRMDDVVTATEVLEEGAEVPSGDNRVVADKIIRYIVFPKIFVAFEDGSDTYGVEFSYKQEFDKEIWKRTNLPADYNQDYNLFVDENYDLEMVNAPEGCSECQAYRMVYTFTNADYEAAKSYKR